MRTNHKNYSEKLQHCFLSKGFGCAMAQVVSRWPLTAEAWVLSWLSLCEIFGG
jgi:hypothetical protein